MAVTVKWGWVLALEGPPAGSTHIYEIILLWPRLKNLRRLIERRNIIFTSFDGFMYYIVKLVLVDVSTN